jgi:MFS family permease
MRSLVGFLVSSALLMLANGIATPTLVAKLTAAGLEGSAQGLVLATWGVGFAGVAVGGGAVAARLGPRRTVVASAAGMALSLAAQFWVASPVLLAAARALSGAAVALGCLAIEPGLGRAAGARRGLVFGIYLVVSNVAVGAGTLFEGLGPEALLVGVAVAGGMALPAPSVPRVGPAVSGAPRGVDFRLVLARTPGAAVAALAGGMTAGSLLAVAPLHAAALGLGPGGTQMYLLGLTGLGALLPLPLGMVADRSDRDRVILAVALLLSGAALAGLALPPLGSVACLVVAGGLSSALYPLGLGLAQARLTAEEMTRASGGYLLAYAVGSVLGPVGAGALVEAMGPSALSVWVVGAGSLAVLGPALRALASGLHTFGAWRLARVRA